MNETFIIFVTRYALSEGIQRREVIPTSVKGVVKSTNSHYQLFHESDYTLDEASAVARAEQMRAKKLASLRKQIAKLEAMDLSLVGGRPA